MKEKKYSEVVIIGAGFAGLWALKTMAGKGVRITVIDRNNYHTFLPLLYQVAAAEIEPEQIAYPVRSLMRGFSACRYVRAEVEHVDYTEKYVLCNGRRIYYDYLVAAPGSVTSYYGVKGAAINSFSLKTLDQAVILRNHILSCFERASYEDDPAVKKGLLSFVVIGGGPTGVEFAGALAELIRKPLRRDFPDLRSMASLYLVEAGERILSVFNEKSSAYALKKLTSMGVQVLLKSSVKEITPFSVTLDDRVTINSRTVVWTAGVTGNVLPGCPAGPGGGRAKVDDALLMEGNNSVYVVGDLANFIHDGRPLPMVATVAIQQGMHAGKNILRRVKGLGPLPFRFRDRGTMATIGRNSAITRILGREVRGFPAWVLWLAVHIMYLIGFRNKILVMINWVWDYLFFEKSVRLILPRCCDSPGNGACLNRR